MSPSRPLISIAMRFEFVTYLNDGRPIAATMATISMTVTNSSSVNPALLRLLSIPLMGGDLREATLPEAVEAAWSLTK
jgi:hypothetical protein